MAPSLLVEITLRQQEATQQLFEEVARLKAIINRNSSDSSKPPSSDFLKKSKKAKIQPYHIHTANPQHHRVKIKPIETSAMTL